MGAKRPRSLPTPSTEHPHRRATDLDKLSTEGLVGLLLDEEVRAVRVASEQRRAIAKAANMMVRALKQGGRMIYVGAGTSGRLGALDATELPPTFSSDPRSVVAVIAGGVRALTRSVEGAEDRPEAAKRALTRLRVGPSDLVCGVAASGTTAFTHAALREGRRRGAATLFITCTKDTHRRTSADHIIHVVVGPEVIAGSTRLKAGTATKVILNAISTSAMIRLGKVYRGRMVDVRATNAKLRLRAQRIVEELGHVSPAKAKALLRQARGSVKLSLAVTLLDLPMAEAKQRLAAVDGKLSALRLPVSFLSKDRRR